MQETDINHQLMEANRQFIQLFKEQIRRVTQAFFPMKKFDIAALQHACEKR